MEEYTHLEPWPSIYNTVIESLPPERLAARFEGRKVGAMRVGIPPRTMEPPQIHLTCERDGEPFREVLTDLDGELTVITYDPKTENRVSRVYHPGENVVIPPHVIHWLANQKDEEVQFTCEYAPHPWDGNRDEPEFENLELALQFVKERGIELRGF